MYGSVWCKTVFDLFKVVIAPFGAISLLLFCFFIFQRQNEALEDEVHYSPVQLIVSIVIAMVSGTAATLLINFLGDLSNRLDHLVFGFAILISCVIFVFEKMRNLRTMGFLTGVSEGVILLLIFFNP